MARAQAAIARVAAAALPKGFAYEWTDLTYQQILAGNSAVIVFPLALLLVFLVLAAQYESLTLPLAIIMIVPMSLLAALTGVWLTHGDNNVFTQIGLIVLVGLSAKNAILIVEFARELEFAGRTPVQAAIEASRLRLRPILMTSLAFIMGVVPLAISTGAGAEMRRAMGVAVFSGMIGVTAFGLFLTPVFYVLLRKLAGERKLKLACSCGSGSIRKNGGNVPFPPNPPSFLGVYGRQGLDLSRDRAFGGTGTVPPALPYATSFAAILATCAPKYRAPSSSFAVGCRDPSGAAIVVAP